MSFFRLDSPAKVHDYARVMEDTMSDKAPLYTLMGASSSSFPAAEHNNNNGDTTTSLMHYVGVEWQLSSSKGFSPRDFCYLDVREIFA